MRPPAYKGNKPYVFISYAHADTEMVFQVVEELQRQKIRIWYDEGIAPGSEWPEDVATHLYNAGMVIAFITPRAMESENCRREINFALSKKKPFLSIILEKTDMPMGMEMQLSARQSILRYNYASWEGFIDKILQCPDLLLCGEAEAGQDIRTESSEPPLKTASPAMDNNDREIELMRIFSEAAAFEQKDDYTSELQVLLKGLKIDSDNSTLLQKIGRAYRRLGYTQKALEYYERARLINPDECTLYTNIAIAYMTAGQNETAKRYFEQGLALYEKNPLAVSQNDTAVLYSNYGMCVGQLGDLNSARKNLRKAKELGYSQNRIDYICKKLNISPKSIDKKFLFF